MVNRGLPKDTLTGLKAWIQCCSHVNMNKVFNLSVPKCPHPKIRNKKGYFVGNNLLLYRLNKLITVKKN